MTSSDETKIKNQVTDGESVFHKLKVKKTTISIFTCETSQVLYRQRFFEIEKWEKWNAPDGRTQQTCTRLSSY
jgi:hypothetical protein